MVVAHCPTYAASSADKQNNVEVMHLCWDLEGVKKMAPFWVALPQPCIAG